MLFYIRYYGDNGSLVFHVYSGGKTFGEKHVQETIEV